MCIKLLILFAEMGQAQIDANKIVTEFFTFDTLAEICRRLVSDYFLLTTDDLTTWESDPEEFCKKIIKLRFISLIFVMQVYIC